MRFVRSLLLLLLCLPATLTAQAAPANGKKVLGVDDYSRWRSIDNAKLSADGKWLVYGVRFTNVVTPDAKPVLHLKNLTTNTRDRDRRRDAADLLGRCEVDRVSGRATGEEAGGARERR
ncbi:MAG: hypothetical protein V9E87_01520 [Gemmatimonadales bacterium]